MASGSSVKGSRLGSTTSGSRSMPNWSESDVPF